MTIPTLLGTGGHESSNQSFNSANYYSNVGLGRSAMIGTVTAESNVSRPIHVAGTVSYLSWGLDTAFGHPLTLTLKKNSSNSTLAVSIGAPMTGWVTDDSHSVSVSIGDVLDFVTNIGVTSALSYSGGFYCVSARFDAATASAQLLTAFGPSRMTLMAENFVTLLGILAGQTAENLQQFCCLAAGTWQDLACNFERNGFSETTTIQSRKNGSTGLMSISIPACTSGYFEDNISFHRDAVSSGDLLDYALAAPAGGTGDFTIDWIGAHFLATDAPVCMIGGSEGEATILSGTR